MLIEVYSNPPTINPLPNPTTIWSSFLARYMIFAFKYSIWSFKCFFSYCYVYSGVIICYYFEYLSIWALAIRVVSNSNCTKTKPHSSTVRLVIYLTPFSEVETSKLFTIIAHSDTFFEAYYKILMLRLFFHQKYISHQFIKLLCVYHFIILIFLIFKGRFWG